MKNRFFIILLILFISLPLYSQSYESQKKDLTSQKKSLLKEQKGLKLQIDSLKAYLTNLDDRITGCKSGLTKIYIKKYGKKNGLRVATGRVWKGMTESMLRDVWGKPDKTHTDKHSWGVFTQWYYGDITYFFKNKILIDWEQKQKNTN